MKVNLFGKILVVVWLGAAVTLYIHAAWTGLVSRVGVGSLFDNGFDIGVFFLAVASFGLFFLGQLFGFIYGNDSDPKPGFRDRS